MNSIPDRLFLAAILCGVACCHVSAGDGQAQIDWLISQQNTNTWLVNSYEDGLTNKRAWTYDQALAAMCFTVHGETNRARRVLNAMTGLQLSDPHGAWHECYDAETSTNMESKLVSGPIAWMVMAINFYEGRSGDTNYSTTAQLALDYLDSMRIHSPGSETNSAVRYSNYANDQGILSTEHNLDAYSAYLYRGLLSGKDSHLTTASNILDFLRHEMWARSTNSNSTQEEPLFWGGWGSWQTNCGGDNWSVNTDIQAWGALALGPLGPDGEDFYRAVEWTTTNRLVWGMTICTQNFNSVVTNLIGFKCRPCKEPPHIHVDFTEHVVAAMRRVGDYAAGVCDRPLMTNSFAWADFFHEQMRRVADTNGGLGHSFCDAGGADTETNDRRNYVASTAWFYFNEKGVNPFAPDIAYKGKVYIRLTGSTNEIVEIGWESVTDWPYKLKVRSDLLPHAGGWRDWGASAVGSGGLQWAWDYIALHTQRFYRVMLGK